MARVPSADYSGRTPSIPQGQWMISDRELRRFGVTQPERIRALLETSGLSDINILTHSKLCADEQFAVFCARAHDECPSLISLLQNDAASARRLAVVLGFSSWWGGLPPPARTSSSQITTIALNLCMTDELCRLLPKSGLRRLRTGSWCSLGRRPRTFMVYRRRLLTSLRMIFWPRTLRT